MGHLKTKKKKSNIFLKINFGVNDGKGERLKVFSNNKKGFIFGEKISKIGGFLGSRRVISLVRPEITPGPPPALILFPKKFPQN